MRRCSLLTALALLAGLAVACGDDADPVVTAPDGPAPGAGAGLLLSVEHVGGLTTPDLAFAQLPLVTIYDDGLTLTPGAMIMIYPGPAVPPLSVGELDEETLRSLVDAARAAGLDQPRSRDEFDSPPVDDAPDTRITVVLDGQTSVTEVPALGFAEPDGEAETGERAAIQRFVQMATDAATEVAVDLYDPDRYRVLPTPYEERPAEDIEPNELDWPAGAELVAGACVAVTGEDAEALDAVLDQATQITRWIDGEGAAWHVTVRPVLPHEPDC